ncbi:extracellular catalytic domain type 1 short-chain-length polyhydroxyalkanoate depolymerase [Haloechinothrix halophila]|uniref:extracellular catalytic domain type 1 short-chain-length polyhydroxyalkanoate depolymerase n=1 Tax=Haloechinothrix halophila TaxID=1069073 RepID=UPI000423C848|nr:PHB depolymerase family esterase [Haloechinothrix halophila]
MIRRLFLAALLAVALIPAGTSVAAQSAPPGEMVERTYTNDAGTRTYFLYVPNSGANDNPLMVWLHGCGGPLTMEAGHALALVAEEEGFTLAYPVQSEDANASQCWNWFEDAHQHRDQGEASIIGGITTSLIDELSVDPDSVYVGGYSAGGAMSTVMGAAYPDVYAAIAPSAGAPYAFDPSGEAAFVEMGERARPMPAWILQGATDEISIYPIGRANMLQWLGTDDFADDGEDNGSVSRLPSSAEPVVVDTDLGPLPLTVEHYTTADEACELGHFLTSPHEHLVNGFLLSEDEGLNLQRLMLDFLLDHKRGGPGVGCG